jgi:hypothetical protein
MWKLKNKKIFWASLLSFERKIKYVKMVNISLRLRLWRFWGYVGNYEYKIFEITSEIFMVCIAKKVKSKVLRLNPKNFEVMCTKVEVKLSNYKSKSKP